MNIIEMIQFFNTTGLLTILAVAGIYCLVIAIIGSLGLKVWHVDKSLSPPQRIGFAVLGVILIIIILIKPPQPEPQNCFNQELALAIYNPLRSLSRGYIRAVTGVNPIDTISDLQDAINAANKNTIFTNLEGVREAINILSKSDYKENKDIYLPHLREKLESASDAFDSAIKHYQCDNKKAK